jgi:hypothetical protein
MSMNYKITISELNYNDGTLTAIAPVYEQMVETLDIKAVIDAVNGVPAKTPRAPRSDRGKKRNLLGEPVPAQP